MDINLHYTVEIKLEGSLIMLKLEKWLSANCAGKYLYIGAKTPTIMPKGDAIMLLYGFSEEEDAMAFKLRWL